MVFGPMPGTRSMSSMDENGRWEMSSLAVFSPTPGRVMRASREAELRSRGSFSDASWEPFARSSSFCSRADFVAECGEFAPVRVFPGAESVMGGGEFEVFEGFLPVCGGGAVRALAGDAEGACEAFGDEGFGEVAAVGEGDEAVDAGVAAVAARVGESGVEGEWFGEEAEGFAFGVGTDGFGEGDVGDAEVAALVAEAAGVRIVALDVDFDAVDAVEADGLCFAVGEADGEAVAIGPIGLVEGAVGDFPEGGGGEDGGQ